MPSSMAPLKQLFKFRLSSISSKRSTGFSSMSYVHGTCEVPLHYETLGQTLRNTAEKFPDREFLVFRTLNHRKTFSQFYDDARKISASLYSLGLRRGDRVGVWGHNYYEWVILQYACAMAGVIQVNINPHYTTDQLRYVIAKSGMRAIFTASKHMQTNYVHALMELVPQVAQGKKGNGHVAQNRELPNLEHVVVFGTKNESINGAWNFNELWDSAENKDRKLLEEADRRVRPDDPVNMQFTSGTTGYPKGATLTHHNLNNNGYLCGLRAGFDKTVHRICIPNPLYHYFGCVIGIVNAVNHGQTCVFPSVSYNTRLLFEAVDEEKCTFLFGTPTMFIDITSSPLMELFSMSSLSGGFIAGAPCPYTLCTKMVEMLNMKDIYILYGSTEMAPLATMSTPDRSPFERIKSVGSVMPHTELLIVDEHGVVVPREVRGELLTRGYNTMLCYWNDEERTRKEISPDRWYHTGDTAAMNEDGTIQIVGRSKDMICKGGETIFPTEVEQFIFKLPYVADVQVVGVPDEVHGETVCAWIRLKENYPDPITPEMIIDACKGKIAHYKVPQYVLIKEQKDFPMTATGKVRKFELQKRSKELLGLVSVKSRFNDDE